MAADVSVTVPRSPPSGATDADAALLPLMLWLSPAFPVGSFAYSHGLEWAVESGDIHDARSLGGWLVDLLDFGAPRSDALLFAECFRAAAMAEDWQALAETNELAVALTTSAERRLETTSQGAAFVARRARRVGLRTSASAYPLEERVAYPAAVASAAAGHGLPLEASLQAFVLAQMPPISSLPSCASGRSARPTARRSRRRSCRAYARLPVRRLARA